MTMRAMVMVGLAACVLATGPVLAQAEAQPAAGRPDREERMRARMAGPGRAAEDSTEEVLTFMREHSPNRVKAMESLPEDSAARRGVMAFVQARYRSLQAVREEDPKLFEVKVRQIEAEDDLYGLLAPTRSSEDREKMRDQIRTATKQLVEENLAEREQRLSRLREELQREELKLKADQSRTDEIINTRTGQLVREGTGALRREMWRQALREEARRENRPMGATTRPVDR